MKIGQYVLWGEPRKHRAGQFLYLPQAKPSQLKCQLRSWLAEITPTSVVSTNVLKLHWETRGFRRLCSDMTDGPYKRLS